MIGYPRRSREELEGRFLGRPAHLEPKGRGETSLLVKAGGGEKALKLPPREARVTR